MALYPLTKVQEFRLKLYVKDFDKSKEFYQQLLGYPVVNEWDRGEEDKGVMFNTGSAIIELLTPEDGYVPLQGTGISLEVVDVKALWNNIKTQVEIVFELRNNEWGDTSFAIKDPDGYKITFFTKIP
jgi:catechol 2,3-dioxygenase-like lactoylglutathione lyase family enzyme